jgi:hypothetical protein
MMKLALKSGIGEEIITSGFVEAEVFKKLGLFEVKSAPKRSNKFASLDGVVRDAYRRHIYGTHGS